MAHLKKFFNGWLNKSILHLNCKSRTVQPVIYVHNLSELSKPEKVKAQRRFGFAETILCGYSHSDSIPWEEVKQTLYDSARANKSNIDSINSLILISCINLKLTEVALSYYKYVTDKNEKLTVPEYFIFFDLLTRDLKKVASYEKLLEIAFADVKPFLRKYSILHIHCAKVFSCLKNCWKEAFEILDGTDSHPMGFLVSSAFKYNEPEKGWEYWRKYPNSFNENSLIGFFNYCIQMAEQKKFSPILIDNLVEYCNDYVKTLPHPNILHQLKDLVSVLNSDSRKTHLWSVNSCIVDDMSVCSNCSSSLEKVKITPEEFEEIKSYFMDNVIINKNIFCKSSKSELGSFLSFLKKCPKYDIVVDALNIMLRSKKVNELLTVSNYFKRKGMKILFIGRRHLIHDKRFTLLQNLGQVFLTENMSDDDVFVLYAALHGGIDTYFLTGDFLRGYGSAPLTLGIHKLFLKWQIAHQYYYSRNPFRIRMPRSHSELPQSAKLKNNLSQEEDYWHLGVHNISHPKKIPDDLMWICLRRKSLR